LWNLYKLFCHNPDHLFPNIWNLCSSIMWILRLMLDLIVCTLKVVGRPTLFHIMILTLAAINLKCWYFLKIFNTFNHVQVSRNTAIISEEEKRNPNIHNTYISQTTSVSVIRLQAGKDRETILLIPLHKIIFINSPIDKD
jgi:hypothetical protein